MSETPSVPGAVPAPPSPSAKPAKTSTSKASRGVHVVFDKDGKAIIAFSGEIDSLRSAMAIGGSARHVAFGERFDAGS